MLCLNAKTRLFVNHKSTTGHLNKSYAYENNNKYTQNSVEKRGKKVSKPFKPQVFIRKLYL